VSKSYPYQPDEFDTIDPNSRPKEVHAARRSTWSRVWPFIVVVIVVPAIAFGVVKYLDRWKGAPQESAATSTLTSTQTQTVIDAPTPPEVTEVVDTPTEEPSPTETASEAAPPAVDRSLPVVVFNAKGQDGLAGQAKERLDSDSWGAVSAETYSGSTPGGASAVYYQKKAQAPSAQLVAEILHIAAVERDKDQTQDGAITVVLRSDYVLPN
jgi:hypothetical protein